MLKIIKFNSLIFYFLSFTFLLKFLSAWKIYVQSYFSDPTNIWFFGVHLLIIIQTFTHFAQAEMEILLIILTDMRTEVIYLQYDPRFSASEIIILSCLRRLLKYRIKFFGYLGRRVGFLDRILILFIQFLLSNLYLAKGLSVFLMSSLFLSLLFGILFFIGNHFYK